MKNKNKISFKLPSQLDYYKQIRKEMPQPSRPFKFKKEKRNDWRKEELAFS